MKIQISIMFLLLVGFCFSQPNNEFSKKQNSISITSGYTRFKEENLHPKVFSGMNLGASYAHTKLKRNISEFSAGLQLSFLNTVYEDFPSALNIMLQGSYKYLFSAITHGKLQFYLGPSGGFQYGTSAYFHWDESHLYYANYASLGLGNRIYYNLGRQTLGLNLEFPLISVISRPKPNRQYKIDDMTFTGVVKNLASNPEMGFPDKNLFVKAEIGLKYHTKRMKSRAIGYHFNYHFMQADKGKPYQFMGHHISYTFIF